MNKPDIFLFSLPRKDLYYFSKIDTNKVNITYTYKETGKFTNWFCSFNTFLCHFNITLFNRYACKRRYGNNIVNAICKHTGLAILDYYVRSDLLQLARKNECKNFFLVIWNSVDEATISKYKRYILSDHIFSYSKEESKKYNIKHINDFYLIDYPKKNLEMLNDFFYLGKDKNRTDLITSFSKLVKNDYKCEFDIYSETKDGLDEETGILYFNKFISFEKYLDKVFASKCLIDFNNHSNITFRTLESLAFEKKYITNNQTVIDMDFYNPNNILVFNEKTTLTDIKHFLEKEYKPVSREILNKYDFYHTYDLFRNMVRAEYIK